MNLQPVSKDQVSELRNWFPDQESLLQWAGPDLPFSATGEQFLEGIFWDKMPALCALDDSGKLLAFGQYYPRDQRCHLARLAVRPSERGKGTGRRFIAALMRSGMQALGVDESSLFVFGNNRAAVRCYESLGFEKAPYPDDARKIPGVQFMISKETGI